MAFFKTPAGFTPAAPHDEGKEMPYGRIIIRAAIAWMRVVQRLDVEVIGAENIPAKGGAMLAVNHTGYWDFVYGGVPAWVQAKRLVRFMAKKEIFDVKGVGALMRSMKHIPVDRADGQASANEAVERLRKGQLVGIFPEATISRSFEIKEFRQGAARIVQEADPNGSIPLIPMTLWGSQRIWTKGRKPNWFPKQARLVIVVGKPVEVTEDAAATTDRLHEAMVEQLDRTRQVYVDRFGPMPEGEYWVPAKLGGSAPSLEEATKEDRAAHEERKRKRAEGK